MAAAAMMAFAACEKEPVYVPGAPTGDNDNVYFSPMNESSVVLASDATEFTVLVSRADSVNALSVPVNAWSSVSGAFTFPATVDFAAGQSTAEYVVKTTDKMEMFKDYSIRLNVSDEFTHAYDSLDVYPRYAVNVIKEDFKPYANGIYLSGFFNYAAGLPEWEQVLEYSAILDQYRFSDLWKVGYGMTFKWDGNSEFTFETKYATGWSAGYGLIYAIPEEAEYDSETKTMTIVVDMYDTSTWGLYPEYYTITELL